MFLAHVNDLADGWSKPLPQCDNRKILTNQNGNYKIYSNVCPHQGSLMLSQPQQQISCQYHGWSWNNHGNPINSGSTKICNQALLTATDTFTSNGILFSNLISIDYLCINFRNFKLVEHRIDSVNASSNNIMDVFLDVDHIPVVHKDVYDKIGIEGDANVEWDYFDWGSVQKVRPSIEIGHQWAAVWIAVFPGSMIEWQPGSLFVTVCLPSKDNSTSVAVWKYRASDSTDEIWLKNETIWETAWSQDKHQSSCIVKFADYKMLEESKKHYRNWLKHEIS